MKLQRIKKLAVSAVTTTALGTALFIAVPPAYAEDHAKCQHNIERAEYKLDQAVRKHGERSHQADQRRRDLNAERDAAGLLPRLVERPRPSMAYRPRLGGSSLNAVFGQVVTEGPRVGGLSRIRCVLLWMWPVVGVERVRPGFAGVA